jgi:ferrochelatase
MTDEPKMPETGSGSPPIPAPAPAPAAAASGPEALALLDIGAPESVADARPFLRRVYSDPHVLQFSLSGLLLELLAWGISLSRGARLAAAVKACGGAAPEREGLPRLAAALCDELSRATGRRFLPFVGYRHASPGIAQVLEQARAAGCRRMVGLFARTFPSAAGSGSMRAALSLAAGDFPEVDVSMIDGFADDSGARGAFAAAARASLDALPAQEREAAHLLFVLQGQPVKGAEDPSLAPAQAFAEVVHRAMGVINHFGFAYQSEVDPRAALRPQASAEIARLAAEKKRALVLVPISHACETLATRWELDQVLVPQAKAAPIAHVVRSAAPAERPEMLRAMAELVQRHLAQMEQLRASA